MFGNYNKPNFFFAFCVFMGFQEKDYVGFATLPNQVHRKSVKKGFDFTLMVAGTMLIHFTSG